MKIQRQPVPDTHCLHATTRVEIAELEGFMALIELTVAFMSQKVHNTRNLSLPRL